VSSRALLFAETQHYECRGHSDKHQVLNPHERTGFVVTQHYAASSEPHRRHTSAQGTTSRAASAAHCLPPLHRKLR